MQGIAGTAIEKGDKVGKGDWSVRISWEAVCRRATGRRAYNRACAGRGSRRGHVERLLAERCADRGIHGVGASIARALGVSEATISRDLRIIRGDDDKDAMDDIALSLKEHAFRRSQRSGRRRQRHSPLLFEKASRLGRPPRPRKNPAPPPPPPSCLSIP